MKAYNKKSVHTYISQWQVCQCATAKYGLGLVCREVKRLGNALELWDIQ